MLLLFSHCKPGRPWSLYRVRVCARVNGDVAQMVSAFACLVEMSRVRVLSSSKYFEPQSLRPRLDQLTPSSICTEFEIQKTSSHGFSTAITVSHEFS